MESSVVVFSLSGDKAPGTQALRRALPFLLRAANTARPPRVALRARKPCVRARLILLGWNVLFMM